MSLTHHTAILHLLLLVGAHGTVEVRLWTSTDYGGSPFVYVNLNSFPGGPAPFVLDTGSPLLWGHRSCFTAGASSGPATTGMPCPPAVIQAPAAGGPLVSFGYGGGAIQGPLLGGGSVLDIYQAPAASRDIAPAVVSVVAPMIAAATDGMPPWGLGIVGMDQASITAPLLFASCQLPRMFQIQLVKPGLGPLAAGGTMVLGGTSMALSTGAQGYIALLPAASRLRPSPNSLNPQGVPINTTSWWQFEVDEVTLGGVGYPAGQAIADTGTSALLVTPAMAAVIADAVRQDCAGYDAYPVFEFRAGAVRISLGPDEYIVQAGGQCYALVESMPELPDNFFVLGDPLFWKYTVLFDYEQSRLGVALSTSTVTALPSGGGSCLGGGSIDGGGGGGGGSSAWHSEKLSAGDDVGVGIAVLSILTGCGVVAMYVFKVAKHEALADHLLGLEPT